MKKGGFDACPPGSPYHEYILRYEDVMTFGAMLLNPLPSSASVAPSLLLMCFQVRDCASQRFRGEKCQPAQPLRERRGQVILYFGHRLAFWP